MNRFSLLPICVALIVAASVTWAQDQKPDAKPVTVEMKSITYDPKLVEVPAGGTVVWTNKAFAKHTATSDDDGKAFDTGETKPGETSSPVKFDKEGEFKYHCKIHGKTMSGTVLVKPAATN